MRSRLSGVWSQRPYRAGVSYAIRIRYSVCSGICGRTKPKAETREDTDTIPGAACSIPMNRSEKASSCNRPDITARKNSNEYLFAPVSAQEILLSTGALTVLHIQNTANA